MIVKRLREILAMVPDDFRLRVISNGLHGKPGNDINVIVIDPRTKLVEVGATPEQVDYVSFHD